VAVHLALVDQLLQLPLDRVEPLLELHRGRLARRHLLLEDQELLLGAGRPLRQCRSGSKRYCSDS